MRTYTGWIILGTFALYLLSVPLPFLKIVPTILAWLVPALMWRVLGKSSRNQALFLWSVGFLFILFSASKNIFLGWEEIFFKNIPLLAMFVAVSFLTLTNPDKEGSTLSQGRMAVIITAIGTHLLGSIINLSVLFLFGGRLKRNSTLEREQFIILSRTFTAAAWWSPFFIATGVALTYAPGMHWTETLIPGLLMSLIAISYSIIEVCFFRKAPFTGYPLKVESLTVPMFLAVAVICAHFLWPHISVLLLTCYFAPVGALIFMKKRPRLATIRDFIDSRISSVGSQFALFLAAGVFSTGVTSLTLVYPAFFSLEGMTLTSQLFAIMAGVMIILGIMGLHPVVSIAIVSSLLLPLHPNPSQLGFLFLTCWAISTCTSPLSGVGLVFVGHFHVAPREVIQSNYLYTIAMWAIASLMNIVFFAT